MDVITPADKAKLEAQLAALVADDARLVALIAEARAHGDLKENAEYHSAREEKSMNDARIRALRDRLARSQVFDPSHVPEGMVFVGAMVEVRDAATGQVERLKIVAMRSDEDTEEFLEVSSASPLGTALIRARVGQTVRVALPRGERHLEIVAIVES